MEREYKYMVATRCFTYNHAPYIEDALRGFAMQKTQFPVVYCIVDDASTDGEQNVLKKWAGDNLLLEDGIEISRNEDYGDVIASRHKGNTNALFVIILLKENHYKLKKSKMKYVGKWLNEAKYHALCEGDDYWIDPLKMQKQVDYLEAHPEVGLVHTDYNFVDIKSKIVDGGTMSKEYKSHIKNGFAWHNYLNGAGFILTCTVMYRSSLILNEKLFLDHGRYMMLQRQMRVYHIPEKTACYRIHPNSMMQSQRGYVEKQASRAIFYQLYYYSTDHVHTNKFYYWNPIVLFTVAKAILSSGRQLDSLDIEDGRRMFRTIVRKNYFTLILFLPLVMITKAYSRMIRILSITV